MSKKHFKAIAEEIAAAIELNKNNPEALAATKRLAEGMARLCGRFNPNFDRGRFLHACGVE